jgi:predicted N-acyltransferase
VNDVSDPSDQPRNIRIETHDGVRAVGEEDWSRICGDNPFVSYGFLAALEDTGCVGEGTGWYPAIITAKTDDTDELLGALPFYIKTHSRGEFVFDWGWADAAHRAGIDYFPKAVVASPMSPVTGRRLLVAPDVGDHEQVARLLIHGAVQVARDAGFSSVHFNFVLPEERTHFESVGLPERIGMQYHWYNGVRRATEEPYEDFDDWLSRFRSKKRANIRRERRKLAEAGVTTRVLRADELDDAAMARMFGYYVDTVRKFFWGHQYLNEDFFLAIRERLPEPLHIVEAYDEDGVPFAGAFNMVGSDRLYGRYWGATEDVKYAHFEVCFYRAIEWCIDEGVRVFEPGAGGEHKYERGFLPTETYSAHWLADPGLDAAVRDFLRRERAGRKAEIEALAEDSPYKSLE